MNKQLGVAVIHGLGSQSEDSFNETVSKLADEANARVDDGGKDSKVIAWQPIYWAEEIEQKQRQYLQRSFAENDLDYRRLRKFVVGALGDAVAYLPVVEREGSNKTYERIHSVIRTNITTLYEDLGKNDSPLIVLAHSLGSVMMSNHIWDIQQGTASGGESNFENMRTLVGLIMFGSTLPLFTFAYEPAKPIQFPPPELDSTLKNKARWYNFFDSDDVLGYPLKQIGADYASIESLEDRNINVGGLLTSWNPLSHLHYWTDDDFTSAVAEFIIDVLP